MSDAPTDRLTRQLARAAPVAQQAGHTPAQRFEGAAQPLGVGEALDGRVATQPPHHDVLDATHALAVGFSTKW